MSDQATIFELPYNLFLMQRMEFVVICGDQLAASIMRVVEAEMIKRKEAWQVRAEKAIEAKKPLPKEPKTWWVQLSQAQIIARLYMYDSAKLKKPESEDLQSPEWVDYRYKKALSISKGTLRKAIDLLENLGFLLERGKPGDEFGAPIWTLHKENVQKALKALPENPFAIFHALGGGSKFEYGGEVQNLNVPPTNFESGDTQNLNVPDSFSEPGEVQILEVDIDITIDLPEDSGIDNKEEDTNAGASSSTRTLENTSYQPDPELEQQAQEMATSVDRETHKRAIGNLTEQTSEQLSQIEEQRAAIGARENDYHSQLSTLSATFAQESAKVAPRQSATPSSKSVTSKNTNLSPTAQVKEQLTLLGGQVRTDYETIRACRLRLTQANIKALNTLGELDGMTFENLKETIELIEEQELVKKRNIPIDPQSLASEDGYWRFDKWYPVVVRNRAKQVSKSSANGQPPLTSASLPSYAHMSDKEYYASLGGVQRR